MAVYVDELFDTIKTKEWPYSQACHMVATTRKELLYMASKLDLPEDRIVAGIGGVTYFLLTKFKRRRAIERGAKDISFNELMRRKKEWW
ncbi:MAG: DUF4031 domain-containing protein [Novosphingobium sp.]|nr:DUF4031 domain-containing protein [Novosphingobium sp.]